MQLKRIAMFLGLKPEPAREPARAATPESLAELMRVLPVHHGRPNDPMLDFLDL